VARLICLGSKPSGTPEFAERVQWLSEPQALKASQMLAMTGYASVEISPDASQTPGLLISKSLINLLRVPTKVGQ
jgi:hypothetical protein